MVMILLIGILISFIGQLPIGYINLISLKIAIEKSNKQAIYFAIGVSLLQLVYVEVILYGINFLLSNIFFYKLLQITTALVFIIVAIVIFAKWKRTKKEIKPTILPLPNNSFGYGAFLNATNFAQVPFWVLCVSYLIETKILMHSTVHYQLFVWGTGVGTFLGILVYIFMGKKLLEKYKTIAHYLDALIAFSLIVAAGFQLFNYFK